MKFSKNILMKFKLFSLNFILIFVSLSCNNYKAKRYHMDNHTINRYELFNNVDSKEIPFSTIIWDKRKQKIDTVCIIGRDVELNESKFRISLVTYCNAEEQNTARMEKLLLSQYGKDSVFIHPDYSFISILEGQNIIDVDQQKYIITFNKDNSFFKIKQYSKPVDKVIRKYYSRIPDIKVWELNGDSTSLTKVQQYGKPMYIDLWHRRCRPCLKFLPKIDSLSNKLNDKILIIGLNTADSLEDIERVKKKLQIDLPLFSMKQADIAAFDFTQIYPMGVLYDKNGKLVDKFFYMDFKQLENNISHLLTVNGPAKLFRSTAIF